MNFGSVVVNGRTRAGLRAVLDSHPPTNNCNTQKNCGKGVGDGKEFPFPDIQMINKFYGLIPKKFLMSERIQPSISLIRQKSSAVRPNTAKPISAFAKLDEKSERLKKVRRCSSVEENRKESPPDTPLVTRRISLERITPKTSKKPEEEVGSESEQIPKVQPQRVIRIDLNRMKWEDDGTNEDETHKVSKLNEKGGASLESPPIQGNPKNTDHVTLEKSSPSTCLTTLDVSNKLTDTDSAHSKPVHWTLGKTTSERRAKLQKSFSIHPSFSKVSFADESFDGIESESGSEYQQYPGSMTRTGRKSLHVEPPVEDVETMVSSRKTQPRSKSFDDSYLVHQYRVTKPEKEHLKNSIKPISVSSPKAPPASILKKESQFGKITEIGTPRKTGSEKQKIFINQHSNSLSSTPNREICVKRPKSSTARQKALTKTEIKSGIESRKKSFGKSRASEPEGGLTRPKTSPSHKDAPRTKSRRQPMRARTGIGLPQLSHVLSPKTETPVFEPDEEMKKLEPGAENRNQKDDKSENEERGPTVGYVTNPVASPRLGSRRTFSLDEDSLLNYSTSISDSIETTESSIQSSKRREECVRIYEKMKNNGCGVKLQTIFRGLMTPSEYRNFIKGAEKAVVTPEPNPNENEIVKVGEVGVDHSLISRLNDTKI